MTISQAQPELCYVVLELGWDYDDEFNYLGEGTTARRVFRSEAAAQAYAERQNLLTFAREAAEGLGRYQGYGLRFEIRTEDLNQRVNEYLRENRQGAPAEEEEDEFEFDSTLPVKALTQDQLATLYRDFFDIPWYEVESVLLEG